jgi:DNA-directed RNA polymerase specialized sigma24 family protein
MAAVDIAPYEGLIFQTARKFAGMAGMEEEDMRQELRLKAAQALVAFDVGRSKLPIKNYVFGCLTNRVTDLRKSHCRKLSYGIGMRYIEDFGDYGHSAAGDAGDKSKFDFRYFHIDHDEVFGKIEEGSFVLPASLTDLERSVLLLLTMEMTPSEIAIRLGIKRAEAAAAIQRLKDKFADWAPGRQPNDSSVVDLQDISVAA